VVVVAGQTKLLQVIRARRPASGFADFLNGGQEQANQNGNDRDYDQKFNQRKCPAEVRRHDASWKRAVSAGVIPLFRLAGTQRSSEDQLKSSENGRCVVALIRRLGN
jgi:hypothetical protein